jgi:lysophospholipase L1-like esterase
MPLEMFADATKEEGKSTTKACGAVKEKHRKHKVLLLADSQARGCADLLKQNLNRVFGVSGLVKPGAKTSDILDTNMEKNMSVNDVIVVCAGTNDISKSSAKEGLWYGMVWYYGAGFPMHCDLIWSIVQPH